MSLLSRSACGGVLILVVLLVRFVLLDRLPKRTFVVLWGIALLRLMLPFSFTSAFSVYSLLGTERLQADPAALPESHGEHVLPEGAVETAVRYLFSGEAAQPRREAVQSRGKAARYAAEAFTEEGVPLKKNGRKSAMETAGFSLAQGVRVVWCAGAVLCALFFTAMYLRAVRSFRTALPVEQASVRRWLRGRKLLRPIAVRQSDRIPAPLTYGIFRPVILLPKRLCREDGRELEYVLQHEYVHICHWDSARKLLMAAALCLHWFNPLVWVMSGRFGRDIELACDEGVLRQFGEKARSNYALTLIGMEEKKCGGACLYNGFSKNAVEERIKSIMKYRKMTLITLTSAVLLVSSVAVVFATSAQETGRREPGRESGATAGDVQGELTDPPKPGFGAAGDGTQAGSLGGESAPEGSGISAGVPGSGGRGLTGAESAPDGGNAEDMAGGAQCLAEGIGRLRYWVEGMPEEEEADLYAGAGYCILVPSQGWQNCAPDVWQSEVNPSVGLWVADFGEVSREQAAESLVKAGFSYEDVPGGEKENAYFPAGTNEDGKAYVKRVGGRLRQDTEDGVIIAELRGQIVEGGVWNTWGIYYTFPPEAEEGFGTCLREIASSFGLLPRQNTGGMTEDTEAAVRLLTVFWQAYLSGDTEAVRQCLTPGYSGPIECWQSAADENAEAGVEMRAIKGLRAEEMENGDRCGAGIEFSPSPQADTLLYLTVELVKEQDGWKIDWYGLEQ